MLGLAGVVALLAAISFAATQYCLAHGYTLYYGDAEAHLNIARRILDSRTPGPKQIGTVWLPLPHLLMMPFTMRDSLWLNGAAGAIVSSLCFVLAGAFLYAAARRVYGSASAALAVALLFALNPNMLYLQATPMTEALFAASLAALLWATLWFRDTQALLALLAAGVASNAASLTRYEGWFLIPFVSLYLLFVAKRKSHAVLFGAIASLAPLAWLAHNQFYYGNPLEFYNGPWSAMAIYKRSLAAGMQTYPGDHNWRVAFHYYFTAVKLVAGWPLIGIAVTGLIIALWKRAWWPLFLLLLAPAFYIWSIHSSGTPVYVPNLWPNSWYNTRYALAILPLAAFAGGALVMAAPQRLRFAAALLLPALTAVAWIDQAPICWKESEVNSIARRAWMAEAAQFLEKNYTAGSGILFPFGDLAAVLRAAGIPLREGLHEGNTAAWNAAMAHPDRGLQEEWVLAISGDAAATAVLRADRGGRHYQLRKQIVVKGGPVVEIYQRQ